MGILGIFKKKFETPKEIGDFNSALNSLLDNNVYISKKDYIYLLNNYNNYFNTLNGIEKNNLLNEYCKKNKFDINEIYEFIKTYKNIDDLIVSHNNNFITNGLIENKEYLDNILKEVDPVIKLDNDQRSAVLNDEDYCMIIAGAGAGKTTTIAAKVRYLVEKKNIRPEDILIVSFTNKAVKELRDRINDCLKIKCPITTFHATGNAIIRKQSDEKLNIISEEYLVKIISEFIVKKMSDKVFADKLVLFFGSYFEEPYDGEDKEQYFNHLIKSDFTTLKSNLNEYSVSYKNRRNKKIITLNNEIVNSYQEVRIANFLYLNGIDYEYEPEYPFYIANSNKRYTPDFLIKQGDKQIYLEHFGISEDGKNSMYTEVELAKYKKCVNDKIILHKKHNTKLIYTFSKYNDNIDLLVHLRELLLKEGIQLNKKDSKEVIAKLNAIEDNKYVFKLVNLIKNFISNFKVNNYTEVDFDKFIINSKSPRTKLFLDICKEAYLEYEKVLANMNAVDFADMINNAAHILREYDDMKEKLSFKYIIVDEYQDISRQRFDLVNALSKVCDAKIIVVGDDWQSIYAFSGADVSLFTKFKEKMGYCSEIKITNTYRNSQEVIDIAGDFIQKNDKQIKKTLKSPKHINDPIIVYSYDDSYKNFDKKDNKNKGALYNLAQKVEEAIDNILKDKEKAKILLIGRFNFDGYKLGNTEFFNYDPNTNKVFSKKYPNADITFLTAHSSKGLGYDDVIILNALDGTFGFPSQIEDDPIMNLVIHKNDEIEYAEERRLFYVALTRTKNRVYIIVPQRKPSEFVVELLKNYKTIKLIGDIEPRQNKFTDKLCLICGYPLQRRFRHDIGLDLWVCTNEQEICGFLTNDRRGGKLSIQKCDKCKDGYLIVKQKEGRYFLGCTNYQNDNCGCNNTIDINTYTIINNITNGISQFDLFKKRMDSIDENKIDSTILKGFDIIVDHKHNILTNIDLLKRLRNIRNTNAEKNNIRPFQLCTNKVLVRIATYIPINREQFISIIGCGERIYENIGYLFIDEINKNII